MKRLSHHAEHLRPQVEDEPDVGVGAEEDEPRQDAAPDPQVRHLQRRRQTRTLSSEDTRRPGSLRQFQPTRTE